MHQIIKFSLKISSVLAISSALVPHSLASPSELISQYECEACHGPDGVSSDTNIPTIAGIPEFNFFCLFFVNWDGFCVCERSLRLAWLGLIFITINFFPEEMETKLGEFVGYKVRFNDQISENTQIKLMTDGILLAEIQHDRFLNQYDTIIIDEAHERSLNIDFILGYLKELLPRRPDLKVIITSATIDPERFSKHFNTQWFTNTPFIRFKLIDKQFPLTSRVNL